MTTPHRSASEQLAANKAASAAVIKVILTFVACEGLREWLNG